jgi:hypothetical protein
MVNQLPLRLRLVQALRNRNAEVVTQVLVELRDKLGTERLAAVLLDVMEQHPDLVAFFATRPGLRLAAGTTAELALANSSSIMDNAPLPGETGRLRTVDQLQCTGFRFRPAGRSIIRHLQAVQPGIDSQQDRTYYVWDAIGRIAMGVDRCAVSELEQLSRDGLDRETAATVRQLAQDFRRAADHLEALLAAAEAD